MVLICLLGILCWCLARRKKSRRHSEDQVFSRRTDVHNSTRKLLATKSSELPTANNLRDIAELAKNNRNETPKNLYQPNPMRVEMRGAEGTEEVPEMSKQSVPIARSLKDRKVQNSTRSLALSSVSGCSRDNRQQYGPMTSPNIGEVSEEEEEISDTVFLPVTRRRYDPSPRNADEARVSYSSDSEVATLLWRPQSPEEATGQSISDVSPPPRELSPHACSQLPPYESVITGSRHSSMSAINSAVRANSPPPSYASHYRPHHHNSRTQRGCACSPSNCSDVTTASSSVRTKPKNNNSHLSASSQQHIAPNYNCDCHTEDGGGECACRQYSSARHHSRDSSSRNNPERSGSGNRQSLLSSNTRSTHGVSV